MPNPIMFLLKALSLLLAVEAAAATSPPPCTGSVLKDTISFWTIPSVDSETLMVIMGNSQVPEAMERNQNEEVSLAEVDKPLLLELLGLEPLGKNE
ncbi:hypothetical protein BDV27DRAFT_152310 [Aspergillus caelatus]|uniref:Uncharacterized protein n=1 Tax=Aspergillus caelatus TaxID=61420 RepID=A0A5N7AK29_9EURO|nr:uncharacterized protein BDV27DRAFT_152310 [Aspergillus caelatus]KAE8370155.1 hypothetical protein BDV27DRAFT_152310 [Aspergillus caelatus]